MLKNVHTGAVNVQTLSLIRIHPCSSFHSAALAASPVSLDYARIVANQRSCQETLKAAYSSSLQLQHVDIQGEKVVCDISTGQLRPLIPVADRRDVFRAIHKLAHAGIRATQRLMASRLVWRGMASDVAAWCRDCQLCARGKASPQHTAPIQPIWYQSGVSPTCMWTWLAPSLHRRRCSSTCSSWWTDHPGGWKPSP
jgi:hypothetical protein